MREIKFKVWSPTYKEFWKLELGQEFNIKKDNIVCQFTGLKDKNGKEIYEGDILITENNDPKYDLWKREEHGPTVVEWSYCFDGWAGDVWTWEHTDGSVYCLQMFVEVIGNIYENPELIERGM